MTKEKIEQIELQALAFSESRNTDNSETSRVYKAGCSFGYVNGAINEAERSEGLVKALEAIVNTEIAPGDDSNEVLNEMARIATAALKEWKK